MNALVIPSPSGLPFEAKSRLTQFAKQLDALRFHVDRMRESGDAIDGEQITRLKLDYAKSTLDHYRQSPVRRALVNGDIGRAEDALLAMVPEWWDADKQVNVPAIARAVVLLIGSFPEKPTNEEIFLPQLIEDIHSCNPHPFEVEEAWRALRLTSKSRSCPPIGKVYDACEAAQSQWSKRWDALDAEGDADYLAELIEQGERALEHERQLQERKEAERARLLAELERRQGEEHEAAANYLRGIDDFPNVDPENQDWPRLVALYPRRER